MIEITIIADTKYNMYKRIFIGDVTDITHCILNYALPSVARSSEL